MPSRPIFTETDVQDPRRMVRLLNQLNEQDYALADQITTLSAQNTDLKKQISQQTAPSTPGPANPAGAGAAAGAQLSQSDIDILRALLIGGPNSAIGAQRAAVPSVTALPPTATSQEGDLVLLSGQLYRFDSSSMSWIHVPLTLDAKGQQIQSFVLSITNSAGTIRHAIWADNGAALGNFSNKISAAAAAYTNTPQVNAATPFAAGGGVDAATTAQFVLDTAAQTVGDQLYAPVGVEYNDTATAVSAAIYLSNLNVNGVTRNRPTILVRNAASGAAFPLTAASIPAGKTINLRIHGLIA